MPANWSLNSLTLGCTLPSGWILKVKVLNKIMNSSKERRMGKCPKGFSLIELLIVVAIILVIAAIAIPNFLRSRVAANQTSAVASLHTLSIAQMTYASTYGVGYSVD